MTIALWSVLIAGLLPLVAVGIAKFSGKTGGGYGPRANLNPRDWLALQDGVSKRATAAQLNSFEALPLFIAGVLVATMMKAPQATIDTLAMVFIAARLAYIAAYVTDRGTLRSLLWFVGMGCSVGLFFVAASAKA